MMMTTYPTYLRRIISPPMFCICSRIYIYIYERLALLYSVVASTLLWLVQLCCSEIRVTSVEERKRINLYFSA